MIDFTPFDGDGRVRVEPAKRRHFPGRPMAVSRSQARAIIGHFLQFGHSTHSASGATLWVLMTYAAHHKMQTRLSVQTDNAKVFKVFNKALPNPKIIGYYFERILP